MLAFSSDSHIEFTSLIRDGAAFAAEWRWAGTSNGPLQLAGKTCEPTGLRFDVPGVAICRTRDDGLIVYHKDYYDVATLVRQTRSVPRTGRSACRGCGGIWRDVTGCAVPESSEGDDLAAVRDDFCRRASGVGRYLRRTGAEFVVASVRSRSDVAAPV